MAFQIVADHEFDLAYSEEEQSVEDVHFHSMNSFLKKMSDMIHEKDADSVNDLVYEKRV